MADQQAAFGGGWMAATAGSYKTQVTKITGAATGWRRVLSADPRRWYVRFELDGATGSLSWVLPGPVQNVATPGNNGNMPLEMKFRDNPSAVVGEWYSFVGAGAAIYITEGLYVGE